MYLQNDQLPLELLDPFDPRLLDFSHYDRPFRIYLSPRDLSIYCEVDWIDYQKFLKWSWKFHTSKLRKNQDKIKRYAVRSKRDGKSWTNVYLHKAILNEFSIPPSPLHTIGDHIDGNSLNNQRSNLRWVTVKENNRNSKSNLKKVKR